MTAPPVLHPRARVWLVAAAIGAVLAGVGWTLRRRLVVVNIDGASMLPVYRPGDRALVRRRPVDRIRAGEVVVVELSAPGQDDGPPAAWRQRHWAIKRVAAAPGDPVPDDLKSAVPESERAVVPPDRLLVLGDNPALSADSRNVGYIPGTRVLGVAVRKLGR